MRETHAIGARGLLRKMSFVLAIHGFLEWFFLGLLTFLVAAVSLFGIFMLLQFFRNPARPDRRR